MKEAIKPVLSAIDQVKYEMATGEAVKTSETGSDQK